MPNRISADHLGQFKQCDKQFIPLQQVVQGVVQEISSKEMSAPSALVQRRCSMTICARGEPSPPDSGCAPSFRGRSEGDGNGRDWPCIQPLLLAEWPRPEC